MSVIRPCWFKPLPEPAFLWTASHWLTPDQRCQVQLSGADCKGSKINFWGKLLSPRSVAFLLLTLWVVCELWVRAAQGGLGIPCPAWATLFIVCWRLALGETICLAFCSSLFMNTVSCAFSCWPGGKHTVFGSSGMLALGGFRACSSGKLGPRRQGCLFLAQFLHSSLFLSCCFSGSEADFSSSSSTGSISAPEVHMSTAGNKRASFSRK